MQMMLQLFTGIIVSSIIYQRSHLGAYFREYKEQTSPDLSFSFLLYFLLYLWLLNGDGMFRRLGNVKMLQKRKV